MSSVHHKDSNIFRSCKFHKKNPKHCIHTPNGFSRASEKCGSGAGGVGVVGVGGGGERWGGSLSAVSAAVAAAEFLTVAISRTPK